MKFVHIRSYVALKTQLHRWYAVSAGSISCLLTHGVEGLLKASLVQSAVATGLVNSMAGLQDNLSNLERIGNTPLPFAYQAHLRMSLW